MSQSEAAVKAWITRREQERIEKDRRRIAKALRHARWAHIRAKQRIAGTLRRGIEWHIVDFMGAQAEGGGIIDLLAVRKNYRLELGECRRGDLLEIAVIQAKAGCARPPTPEDRLRLKAVAKRYDARVVLATWRPHKGLHFSVLEGDDWVPKRARDIFGQVAPSVIQRSPSRLTRPVARVAPPPRT
jgi:hypothetical protein